MAWAVQGRGLRSSRCSSEMMSPPLARYCEIKSEHASAAAKNAYVASLRGLRPHIVRSHAQRGAQMFAEADALAQV